MVKSLFQLLIRITIIVILVFHIENIMTKTNVLDQVALKIIR